ncbi:hypothetical protein V2G26_014323 [Clonostachys chloroleuca]
MIRFATDLPHHLVEKHSHTLRFETCGACVHSRTSVRVPIYLPKEIFQIVSFTFPSSHINTYQRESCTRWNCRALSSGQTFFASRFAIPLLVPRVNLSKGKHTLSFHYQPPPNIMMKV